MDTYLSNDNVDRPQGLAPVCFNLNKIEHTADTFFTPDLYFPFLICEANMGPVGLEEAELHNVHSGSVAQSHPSNERISTST